MAEPRASHALPAVAVIGLACRFPDADDAPALLDTVLTGRRAFRRLPPARLDLADYYQPDPAVNDATYSARAGLLEGWRFDRSAFGVSRAAFSAADRAHWLALETAARALAAAGLPSGVGLDRDRIGVILGNSLAGDTSRANALRVRWPYVRRSINAALADADLSAEIAGKVLGTAEAQYLAPFPPIRQGSLAGSMPAGIAAGISSYFGFRGGSYTVDSGGASSLQAVASACAALGAGDLDLAIAGGVDVGLDPLELIGMARTGALAASNVRIYDRRPTGYLPAEGCGVVVLMRSALARSAGLPVYAEIVGWGTSADGGDTQQPGGELLAIRRAYERAGVDPAQVQFVEGNGTATRDDDDAELGTWCRLRSGARSDAALGSVKANIGHARAAAGAAGLIKTVLAVGAGVIPPATGAGQPHPLLRNGDARLRLPEAAADWPAGVRLAGVSAGGPGGNHVHLVLRHEPDRPRPEWALRGLPRWPRTADQKAGHRSGLASGKADCEPGNTAFLLHADDWAALASELTRLSEVAAWLSDAEMADLGCQLARRARSQGKVRVAIVARQQEQLALLAGQAAGQLPELGEKLTVSAAGIFAADNAAGSVTLLLPDGHDWPAADVADEPAPQTAAPSSGRRSRLGRAVASARAGAAALAGNQEHASPLADDDEESVRIIRQWAAGASAAPAADGAVEAAAVNAAGEPDAAQAAEAETGQAGDSGKAGQAAVSATPPASGAAAADQPPATPGLAAEVLGAAFVPNENAPTGDDAASEVSKLLDTLRWLDALGVAPTAAVGQGIPVLAWLVWADLLYHSVAVAFACALAGAADQAAVTATQDRLTAALNQVRPGQFGCGLISAATGLEVTDAAGMSELVCGSSATEISLAAAARAGALDATMLVDCGSGSLAQAAAELGCETPVCIIGAGRSDQAATARVAAALFAAGALTEPPRLFAGRQFRPVDIWRERVFITNPCQVTPGTIPAELETAPEPQDQAEERDAKPAYPADARAAAEPGDLPASQPADSEVDDSLPADSQPVTSPAGLAGLRDEFERHPPVLAKLVVAGQQDRPAEVMPADMPAAGAVAAGTVAAQAIEVPPGIGGPTDGQPPDGVASWVRCFTEELRPLGVAAPADDEGPWRVLTTQQSPFGAEVSAAFTDSTSADRTLAVLGDPADPQTIEVALSAARDSVRTKRLVVITTGGGLTGFFATLHAEQPTIGVTVLRAPATPDGLLAARRHADARPGEFRELSVTASGAVSEVGMTARPLPGGADFPLGPQDVVLISRASRGTGLVLAQVLACCGSAIAVVGRPCADDDSQLVAGLEQLRSAGARLTYEVVDESNPVDMAAALVRIERRLGPVTAIGHAAAVAPAGQVAGLTADEIGQQIASQHAVLEQLASAVPAGRLRLIVTFGSVAECYGLPAAGALALTGAALASQARQLATTQPGCRTLHVDLPGWATPGLGEPQPVAAALKSAGVAPLEVAVASRILLKALTSPDLPDTMAVHGRVGIAARRLASIPANADAGTPAGDPPEPATAAGELRFVRDLAVHYPAIELISEPTLSLASDPYLADYRVDELPVLPPVVALEALAQAASVLAGRPVRAARKVSFDSPVVIPASDSTAIRVCALRDGDTIAAVLRCAASDYRVDHVRAEFSCADAPQAGPVVPAQRAAGDSQQAGTGISLADLPASTGIVDGAEMYGPICFQSGRFRRIAILPEVTARSCRALTRGADDEPWFAGTAAASVLLLGSPGLNDSALQALQACVPHRQLRPASCESVLFSGRPAKGVVQIMAVAADPAADTDDKQQGSRQPQRPEPAAGAAEPASAESGASAESAPTARRAAAARHAAPAKAARRAAGKRTPPPQQQPAEPDSTDSHAEPTGQPAGQIRPAEQLWDITATDAAGQPVMTWRCVRMRDAGPLPRNAAWPPALLSVFLERGATDLGLDASLRVAVVCGQPQPGHQPADDDAAAAVAASGPAAAGGPADPAPAGPAAAEVVPAQPQVTAEAAARPAAEAKPARSRQPRTAATRSRAAAKPVTPAEPAVPAEPVAPAESRAAPADSQPAGAGGQPTAAQLVPAQARPADAEPARPTWARAQGTGLLAGFTLSVSAVTKVACGWLPVQHKPRAGQPKVPGHAAAHAQLRDATGEPADVVTARLAAVSQCLSTGEAGSEPAAPTVLRTTSDGWVLLSAGAAAIASTVVEMSGLACPVAIAIMTGQQHESQRSAPGDAAAEPAGHAGRKRQASVPDAAMAGS